MELSADFKIGGTAEGSGEGGTPGANGITIFMEPDPPEDPILIPGPSGIQGATGSTGATGANGITIFMEPDPPEDPMLVPGNVNAMGTVNQISKFISPSILGNSIINEVAGSIGIAVPDPSTKLEINSNGLANGLSVYRDDGSQAAMVVTTYNVTGGGIIHGNLARGTRDAPTAVLSGDITGGIGSRPYNGSAFAASSPTSIHWVAAENFTTAHYGSYLRILTTPIGSIIRQERVIVSPDGTLWSHDTSAFDPRISSQTKPAGDVLVLASGSAESGSTGVSVGAFSYGSLSAGFRGGVAAGTVALPAATVATQLICFMGGHGFDGTNWSAGTKALLGFKAAETWTPTAQGTLITLETTPIGSLVRAIRMTIADSGNITMSNALTVTGAFGCNNATAQTPVASGGALASYVTGVFGLNSSANMQALFNQVVKIRSALVANGIMS